jgi:MOSC domain-containing protein YiiM
VTTLEARVEAVCLSIPGVRVAKAPHHEAFIGPHGLVGDRHEAEFRQVYGRLVPNQRQWSAVSTEEVESLCADLGVPPFAIGDLGENIRFSGVVLADVPDGSLVQFPSGAKLTVSSQNVPCINAAIALANTYGEAIEETFVRSAYGRRGLVGSVLKPGFVRKGDIVQIVLAGRVKQAKTVSSQRALL